MYHYSLVLILSCPELAAIPKFSLWGSIEAYYLILITCMQDAINSILCSVQLGGRNAQIWGNYTRY